jgi:hypothetical protein
MTRGLTRQMLAATEADFEPDTPRGGAEEDGGEEFALPRFRDREARQEIVDKALLSRRKRLAGSAAVKAVAGMLVHGRG